MILPIHLHFGTMYTYFIEYLNASICPKGQGYSYISCLYEGIHIH